MCVSQVCQEAADVVELFIYLGEPCHVCQLLLTISHGADDTTYPSTVDIRAGCYLDKLKLVVEVCISLPSFIHLALYDFISRFSPCSLLPYEVEESYLQG